MVRVFVSGPPVDVLSKTPTFLQVGAVGLCAALGCRPVETKASTAPVGAVTTAARSEPPKPQGTLIVAGEGGVFELSATGEVVRQLEATGKAAFPRFVRGNTAIVFVQEHARLVELELATGATRVVAGPWQASVQCDADVAFELAIQTHEDVVVDRDGRHVCINLLDRNVNMASAASRLRIDLESGRWEQGFTAFNDACRSRDRAEPVACEPDTPPASRTAPSFPYSFGPADHTLLDASRQIVARIGQFELAAEAPAGRYQLLRGNFEDGDYIHFQFLLLDRSTGEVFPLPAESQTKPQPRSLAALTKEELADPSREVLGNRAGDIVGETSVHFVNSDTLVVGRVLFRLAQREVVTLPGDLAW